MAYSFELFPETRKPLFPEVVQREFVNPFSSSTCEQLRELEWSLDMQIAGVSNDPRELCVLDDLNLQYDLSQAEYQNRPDNGTCPCGTCEPYEYIQG